MVTKYFGALLKFVPPASASFIQLAHPSPGPEKVLGGHCEWASLWLFLGRRGDVRTWKAQAICTQRRSAGGSLPSSDGQLLTRYQQVSCCAKGPLVVWPELASYWPTLVLEFHFLLLFLQVQNPPWARFSIQSPMHVCSTHAIPLTSCNRCPDSLSAPQKISPPGEG